MTKLLFDLETDGLLDTVTKIHCIVTIDADTGEVKQYHDDIYLDADGGIIDGLSSLQGADTIIAHNYIGFDRKVINKLYPHVKLPAFHDTYILSQMLYANEMETHSIARWGFHFGRAKPAHEDWTKLSDEMLHRCREDTWILKKLWNKLDGQLQKFNMTKAIGLEYKVYEIDCEHEHWYLNVPQLLHWMKRLTLLKTLLLRRIEQQSPLIPTQSGTYNKIYKKDGSLNSRVDAFVEEAGISKTAITGPFSKLSYIPINPKSTRQICRWLLNIGWDPDEFNYKRDKQKKIVKDEYQRPVVTSPKLAGDFRGLPEGLAALLKKFNQVVSRLQTLEGYNKKRKGNKIPTFAYTCGTNTARYKHRGVVNVPKASKSVYLGRMMRSLFTVPEGCVLVGADASQLESRIEGHYTAKHDGGEYADFLLNQDVHTATAKQLGITRNQGKTLNYALQYGCSYNKVAKLLEVSDVEAKGIVALYWEMRPAPTAVKEELINAVKSRGYDRRDNLWATRAHIKTIDGRPIFVRSWHSLVNSLIQSTGMVCMKVALCMAYQEIKKQGLDARLAIMYHDEYQWIVKKGQQDQVKQILIESIGKAGKYFDLRVPLEAEGKSGNSWRETH